MPIRGGICYKQNLSFKKAIRVRDDYTCQLCGEYGYIVDHIVPYAVSGETKPEGVRVLCSRCNLETRRPNKCMNLELPQWFEWVEAQLQEGSYKPGHDPR